MFPKESYNSLVDYYGPIGSNQVYLDLPYQMRLSWDLNNKISRFLCHKKIKDSLRACLEGIYNLYGKDLSVIANKRMDIFGGCLNIRKKRGSTSQWSTHAWGIAIDLDPDNNRLKWGRSRATMPEEVIDIFINSGWTSLGRREDRDYMHFQATG
jgi:hypothetical protein